MVQNTTILDYIPQRPASDAQGVTRCAIGTAMGITRIARTLAGLVFAAAAFSTNAACRSEEAICAADSPWFSATHFTVQIEFPGTDERGSLAFAFADAGSLAIDSEQVEQGESRKGKILLINSRLMLTDFEPEKGREIFALDSPVLLYQLAITLLATAFPEGPQDFKGKSVVELEDRKRGIAVGTSSTSGLYRAPWHVMGSIRRKDPQSIEYDFEFESFFGGGQQRTLGLKGVWTKSFPAVFDHPTQSLKDWKAYSLEGYTVRQDGPRMSDGAKAIAPITSTLGELLQSMRGSRSGRR